MNNIVDAHDAVTALATIASALSESGLTGARLKEELVSLSGIHTLDTASVLQAVLSDIYRRHQLIHRLAATSLCTAEELLVLRELALSGAALMKREIASYCGLGDDRAFHVLEDLADIGLVWRSDRPEFEPNSWSFNDMGVERALKMIGHMTNIRVMEGRRDKKFYIKKPRKVAT